MNIDIPAFIAKVADEDMEGAYAVLSASSALPAVCGRVCPQENQCEGKWFAASKRKAWASAVWSGLWPTGTMPTPPSPVPEVEKKGKKVAVIGSGPAGIACAGDLAALGYEVTVFEKLTYAGGILTYGIPTFVLPRSVVDRALKTLWAQGVEIVTGAPVDGARTVDDLFAAGYQAVFVGNGADVLMRRMLKTVGAQLSEEQVREFRAAYDRRYESEPMKLVEPYPGIPEALRDLKARGMKLGVLSNKPDNMAQYITGALFDGLVDQCHGQRSGVPKKAGPHSRAADGL